MRQLFPALARGVSRSRVLAGFPRAARPAQALAAHASWAGGVSPLAAYQSECDPHSPEVESSDQFEINNLERG
ncbi:unnamed protein product [Rangifer tarandus platyrhynchus]|uniref:Uncharacterized protein n=1 Tax=Rangifer tarandus platyrhynchus TaxID=3082113 RepID=A0AC59YLW3_RANTA